MIPEALGEDEKQMGRFLVEDTRRIIHVMQPNGEYKTYRPLPPPPGYSYRHPSGILQPYGEPNSYSYQPRPCPYEYANPQRNYINKEFSHPGYQHSVPQLSPSSPPLPIPLPVVPHPPIYKNPPLHHLFPTAPSSGEVTAESDAKSEQAINLDQLATTAKGNDQKGATKVDGPYRVQLDLGEQLDKVKADATAEVILKPQGNHQDIIHPGLQIPIPLPHPAIHPMDNDEKDASEVLKQLEELLNPTGPTGNSKLEKSEDPTSEVMKQLGDLLKDDGPQIIPPTGGETAVISNPEKSDDLTSEILKQLGGLLKGKGLQVSSLAGSEKPEKPEDPSSDILKQLGDLLTEEGPQQATALVEGETTGTSNPEKCDNLNASIMKQLEDLLKQELPLQNTSVVDANLKPENSDDPTDGILKQLEDLLRDGIGQQNASLVESGTLNGDVSSVEVTTQTLDANNVSGKNPEKDYTGIINAIMATDNIADLVNNPLITADALKEIAQLLNIQQGNQDSIDPVLASEQEDPNLRAKENTHSKTSSLDSLKDNYTEVLSAIIETDRVEDLVNNPNISTDVLKEIADILESEQGALVTEGNLLNAPLATQETSPVGQLVQEGSIGLFPIGIETESGEVLPMSAFNNSLPLASNGKVSTGSTKAPKRSSKRRSKTLRREDDGKELYFLGSTNKIIRIPENLVEKPLLMISNENILAAKLLNGTLERILSATAKNA
ncbi:unnamed protein product [Callosobruchus maculatus]|uniref:Uncharacterized protein n=1 Tax=Callosobruchus maculatus TaxID=64391 RepID=A0A653DRY1_CALMS|nr:unnamed protein product [Callosobruchus maculatus]